MKSNAAHTTYVVKRPEADHLYFDSYSMSAAGGTADEYMRLMAHFPLLVNSEPKDALLICFGVGNTASAIAAHDCVERIDVVELNDKVFETAPEFARTNLDVAKDSRVRLIHNDGRNYLQHTDRRYDLITSEPPPPMEQGVFRLYSKEYYESVRDHLAAGGLMAQWLPLLQMPKRSVEMAISTFVSVFSHTLVFAGSADSYILVGSMQPIELDRIAERYYDSVRVQEDLRRILVLGPVNLLVRILKLDGGLRQDYANFPTISDLRNDLTYMSLDPQEPATVTYDPQAVLAGMNLRDREVAADVAYTLSSLGRLKSLVLSFPESALMSTRLSKSKIALSDVDWDRVGDLMRAAQNALYLERDVGKARVILKQAVNISDRLPHVVRAYAALQEASGDDAGALKSWMRLQSLDPRSAHGYHAAGSALVRMQRFGEAVPHLKRAAELDGANAATLQLLPGPRGDARTPRRSTRENRRQQLVSWTRGGGRPWSPTHARRRS
jgi:spermidine synthase